MHPLSKCTGLTLMKKVKALYFKGNKLVLLLSNGLDSISKLENKKQETTFLVKQC